MASDFVTQLHTQEASRLLRFFRACLRSPQDAADATQETFLHLLRVPDPDAIANPQAYLFKVARSVAIATGVRAAAERNLFVTYSGAVEAIACDAPGPERIIASRQELALLARAIDTLPRRCREVFVLSRLHGLPNGAIGEQLGISRNMVEKHIMRALLTCRQVRRAAGRQ
jgi:RNA polymerase sigma factor (sigma-70 family)